MTARPVFTATVLVWPLLAGMALLMLGNGLQGTLLGVRATLEAFPAGVTGMVMAGYFLGFLAGSLVVPGAIARVGHLRVFAALTAFASVAILVHSVFVAPWIWGAMRVVTGFSFAGLYIVAESWLNDRVTNEHRGSLLSVYMIVTYVGMAAGQLLLNLADPGQHELFILVSVVVSLASVPILLTATQPPEHARGERIGALSLLRVSRLASIGCFATGVAQGALFAMTAVYGAEIGLSVAEISLLLTAVIAGGALAQWPIGWLSDRIERRLVITATAFGGAAAALAAGLLQSLAFPALLAAMAVVGASALTLYSLFNAHMNDRLRQEHRVAASSGLILAFGLGAVIGPPGAGWLMSHTGPTALLAWVGGVLGVTGAFAAYRRLHGPPLTLAEQTQHVPVVARTPSLTAGMVESPEALAEAGATAAESGR